MFDKIKEFVNEYINPGLSLHNGYLEVSSFNPENGSLYVVLKGSCQGCAASKNTLYDQIAVCLTEEFSFVKSIVDLTDHEKGENPFFKREQNE